MSEAPLDTRRRALENAFFIEEDRRLTRRMIEADTLQTEREEIAAITGITDTAVLDQFIELDLRRPALAALALAPLVLVAWADNDVGLKEHETIMHVAEEVGLKPGNEAHELLFDWMLSPPSATLLPVWEAFTKSFIAKLDDQARVALRDEVMGRARRVAEAQGGIFRFSRISSAESAMLDRIALVLS